MLTTRQCKHQVLTLLAQADWEAQLPEIMALPTQKVVGALFGALHSSVSAVRWHAVTAFGLVVAGLADTAPEKARIIMRRFLWNLNEESGGIGWGSAEAMAEIMAQSPLLAKEYHNHLLAYIHEDHCRPDCYLEYAPLRRGAVWGLGRLSQVRPDLTLRAEPDLLCALKDCDGPIRGLAAWTCGILGLNSAAPGLQHLQTDATPLDLYTDRREIQTTVARLAQEALTTLSQHPQATT